MVAVLAALGLMPACDSVVDGPGDSDASGGSSTDRPPGGSTGDTADTTGASPVTTSPSTTTASPNPTTPPTATATAMVTTAGSFGTGSSGFGSSDSGVGPDTCGNGAVDFAEQCDGADLFGFSCEALGLGEGVLTCSEACLFDTAGCVGALPDCGDGLVQEGEQCDQADLQGFTCEALGLGGGSLSCALNCTFDTSGCFEENGCGNGVIEPGEQCDSGDLQGFDCTSLGLGGGELVCDNVQCVFDTSGCSL